MGKLRCIKSIPILGDFVFRTYLSIQKRKIHQNNKERTKQFNIPTDCKKVYYLDIPVHSNLGDIAQYLCTRKWILENYKDYELIEIDGAIISDLKCGMLQKIAQTVSKDDIIFFQSGYCTQDLGGYHDLVHKEIIKACHNTPIVMLPQTVLYQNKSNADEATEVYQKHGKILFLARDFVSEAMAKKLFPNLCVEAFPDVVTSLIGTKKIQTEKDGVMFCIRSDSEKYYSDNSIEELETQLKKHTKVTRFDTSIDSRFSEIQGCLEDKVDAIINRLGTAKVVITDRYHGTIFSVVAGTPVIVIQSTDHKVKTGVEWFKGVFDNYVYYAETLDEAEKLALQIISQKKSPEMISTYFKDHYYDTLKSKIDAWMIEQ